MITFSTLFYPEPMKNTTTFLLLAFVLFACNVNSQGLVINEILASNNAANTDEDGDHQDWLELFNGTAGAISLNGYGLTDNPSLPFKWVFPDYNIQPGEHLLVWCSDKNRTNPAAPLHTNWKISNEGETIRLSDALGNLVDQIPPVVLGSDVSYGRTVSGGPDFTIFVQPTPGAPNSDSPPSESLAAPVFSVSSGFYTEPFSVSITHPEPGVTILYTLDGSEPNSDNIGGKTYHYKNQYPEFPGQPLGELMTGSYQTQVYAEAIEIQDRSALPNDVSAISTTFHQFPYYIPSDPVKKATVVRAMAVKNGYNPSPVVTQNYFFSQSVHSLPVISINLNEDLFFDYERGIHVAGKDFDDWRMANPDASNISSNNNYQRSGDATESRANFSFFKNGQQELNQDVGIRINGGSTRHYPNKALRIYARSEYGNGNLNYVFFNDLDHDAFKTIILRNSGNDILQTYFRDAFIQRASAHMNVSIQHYQPAVVYLNSEYWGLLNIRERYDKHYFKRAYGVDDDKLDFLEFTGAQVQEGNPDHYIAMLHFMENNDLSVEANYEYIQTQLDPENFTDYFIANIYARNTDWPHNNIEFWRKQTAAYEPNAPYGQDGRWRWVLKDTDFGFGNEGGPESYMHNTLAHASSTGGDVLTNPEWSTFVFRKLLENPTFRNNFINRFADMINTAYLPERLEGIISEMKARIADEILQHGERWESINAASWEENINTMVQFAQQRPQFQRDHIRDKFNIAENVPFTLNVNMPYVGYIKINTINLNDTTPGVSEMPYPWSGIYFKDIPVKLKAIAQEGYTFSHWSGDVNSTEPEITVTASQAMTITANFNQLAINDRVPIYFWALSNTLPNLQPFTAIDASYESAQEAQLTYVSCLPGYPYTVGHPNWRKASMERSYDPTPINYLPQANYDILYANASIMGIKVKPPYKFGEGQNALQFSLPSNGHKNLKMAFAARNSNSNATAIELDYAINAGVPVWIKTGLPVTNFALNANYASYEVDFTPIPGVNGNPNFKVRLQFTGNNLEANGNGFVGFNNVSLIGSPLQSLQTAKFEPAAFELFPNPFTEKIYVKHALGSAQYELFSLEGKWLQSGSVATEIDLSELSAGMYLLRLSADGKTETKKIIKQ